MSFVNALRAEVLKLTTTRLWWALLLVLVGYVAFVSGVLGAVFGGLGEKLAAVGGNVPTIPESSLHLVV